MFEWKIQDRQFHIRDVEGEVEHHAVEDLQKEAWQFSDLDVVPAATLIATQHAGGIVLGAFEGELMVGFAYAFPAFESGRPSMHSHMLAVKPAYRNFQAGYYLKLAQRQRTLEKGLDEITWTFDPLQSLNAHFNFAKLGVISNRYLVNFYGEATSSPLHSGFGTDRLWVRWLLNTERVNQRIAVDEPRHRTNINADSDEAAAIIRSSLVLGEVFGPAPMDFSSRLTSPRCAIEIPGNINALKERQPRLGVEWREATRVAFLAALAAKFTVSDFVSIASEPGPRWFYLLARP